MTIRKFISIDQIKTLAAGVVLLCGYLTVFVSPSASAVNGFNPGRIIDNSVFTNTSTMSPADIQNFLNSQMPNCDTSGSKNISYWWDSGTGYASASYRETDSNGNLTYKDVWTTTNRATYGQRYDSYNNTSMAGAPYVCLENYLENPSTNQNNLQGATVSGGESAAQIIYNAAQQYQINPQVLVVTLQKEQGLVTDDWPWTYEYQEAMGFNCPDSSGCSGYTGLYNQVTAAAKQYRNYLNNPNNFNYVVGNNNILFSPASCGSSTVNIQTTATGALYDYTPYQPDANVLANTNQPGSASGPGFASGDSCSDPTYGNRNFWWYFNTWFGASISSGLPGCTVATNTTLACVWMMSNPTNNDQFLTSSINTRDELSTTQNYQYTGIAFYGNVIMEPGNVPVYRASVSGGGSFLTTDQNEYNSLVSSGWTGNGVDFYADPGTALNTGIAVYRAYNKSTGQHYWTSDWSQVQNLINNGWTYEGVPFVSIDTTRQETPPPAGDDLVYRFYIPQTYSHFWTTDLGERDSMIQAGYDYEGVAWYSSTNTSLKPVYRLYAPSINQHLWTTDISEKNNLVASGGWNYEGISQYVSTTTNSSPVYRLYAPSLGVHLYTADSNERNQLIASGHWNNEGVAWYQP